MPYWGASPLSLALTACRGRARSSPPPSCSHAVCARGWTGGPHPGPGPRLPGGCRWCVFRGSPPCRCCAPLVHAADRGVPLPLLPLCGRSRYARAAVWGGSSSPSCLRAPRSVCALGSPFRVWWPPLWEVPLLFLTGVPPLSLASRRGRALLGGVPLCPSPPCRPLALSNRGRSRGGISSISSSAVLPIAVSLLGVLSPPAVCWSVPDNGAGLALPLAPSDAASAAAGVCASECPAPSFVPPPQLSQSLPTRPPAAAAKAAPVGCAAGCPALLNPVSVLAASSTVPIAVAPRGAALSLPSDVCSWVGWLGGGFSPPPILETEEDTRSEERRVFFGL